MQSVEDILKRAKFQFHPVVIQTSIVKCVCGANIATAHPRFRGHLINEISRLGSELVRTREQIQDLKTRRKLSVSDVSNRHELEQKLPKLEGEFFGLRFLEREMFSWEK